MQSPPAASFIRCTADLSAATKPHQRRGARPVDAAGRVDILVNNAGIIRRADALDVHRAGLGRGAERESEDAVLSGSGRGAADGGRRARGGKIINIASMLSFQGGIRTASYTASKSGLAGVTPPAGQRVGGVRHQRQRASRRATSTPTTPTALRADEQRNTRHPESHSGRPRGGEPSDLGGAAVFPGVSGVGLCPRHHPARRRRVALLHGRDSSRYRSPTFL